MSHTIICSLFARRLLLPLSPPLLRPASLLAFEPAHQSPMSRKLGNTVRTSSSLPAPRFVTAAAATQDLWRSHFTALMEHCLEHDHFDPRDEVTKINLELIVEHEPAAVKRGLLSFARRNSHIFGTIDAADVKALVAAGLPSDATDRKTRNAYRRLEASILKGEDLSEGNGGAADLQDVVRLILALVNSQTAGAELATAAATVLPQLLRGSAATTASPAARLHESTGGLERNRPPAAAAAAAAASHNRQHGSSLAAPSSTDNETKQRFEGRPARADRKRTRRGVLPRGKKGSSGNAHQPWARAPWSSSSTSSVSASEQDER